MPVGTHEHRVTFGEHPKPWAQRLFLALNALILLMGLGFIIVFAFAYSNIDFRNFVTIVFGVIGLILGILAVIGALGSRYGPKGKETYLSCLVIYFFTLFIIVIFVVIAILYFIFSNNYIKETLGTFGQDIVDNLALWLRNLGTVAKLFYQLSQQAVLIVVLMSILSIILVFGLFISAYIMGTRSFIKANMSFGSIFVVLSGIALGAFGLSYREELDLGGTFGDLGLILVIGGALVVVIGIAGIVFSTSPVKCYLPLNVYALLLLVILGVLLVFGVVVLLFPGSIYYELLDKDCATYQTRPHFEIDKGYCSQSDIWDKVANNILNGILSSLELAAFTAIIVGLNTDAMKVDLLTAKAKTGVE
ncbi:MAG: hypothetical protein EZS28_013205 [Streblomastix strix]|uniref:Uncharacterized protein n=1 Tax=Streblomastix strix TaxID=222440 RepID=A0A5J4WA64_9EUKA|nr:MAG: hypothetical protein EZS28_013205 [Streblomastix strix]